MEQKWGYVRETKYCSHAAIWRHNCKNKNYKIYLEIKLSLLWRNQVTILNISWSSLTGGALITRAPTAKFFPTSNYSGLW